LEHQSENYKIISSPLGNIRWFSER